MREIEVLIRDNIIGENVTIMKPSNVYESIIGDNVFIGPFVEIQKNVKIGNNTRVQSHSFICELVDIGENCFISHGVMFINDTFRSGKMSRDVNDWKETKIGNNVLIGTNSTILPVTIVDDVIIGAGSVVIKDILEKGVYAGNPARKIKN